MKRGDTVIYHFGFEGIIEAKVLQVYGNELIKVRHKDSTRFTDIIRTDRVLGHTPKKKRWWQRAK